MDTGDFEAREEQAHAKIMPAHFAFCAADAGDDIGMAKCTASRRRRAKH